MIAALRRLIPGLALLLLAGAAPAMAHESAISVGLDANESPPYWSESLPYGGMGGEIVQAVSEEAGLVSHIHFKPLQRMIEDDTNNDLGNPGFYTRNQVFADIIPIIAYRSSIFYYAPHHKGPVTIHGVEGLKKYRIGILSGTLAERSFFDKAGVVFEESYSQDSLFKKLRLGRIDLCIEIDLVGHRIISRLFPDQRNQFVSMNLPGSASVIAILLAEGYPQAGKIGTKYREGLQRIIANGKYRKILEKYYGEGRVPANWRKDLQRFERIYDFSAKRAYQ